MNKKILTVIVIGALSACSQSDSGAQSIQAPVQTPVQKTVKKTAEMKVTHVDAVQALEMIKSRPDLVVVDIRTPAEYAAGHIDGAINIDYKNPNFDTEIARLDSSKDYLVHCHSGGRSKASLRHFKAKGFSHIIHMDGGIKGWKKAHQPTVQ